MGRLNLKKERRDLGSVKSLGNPEAKKKEVTKGKIRYGQTWEGTKAVENITGG